MLSSSFIIGVQVNGGINDLYQKLVSAHPHLSGLTDDKLLEAMETLMIDEYDIHLHALSNGLFIGEKLPYIEASFDVIDSNYDPNVICNAIQNTVNNVEETVEKIGYTRKNIRIWIHNECV